MNTDPTSERFRRMIDWSEVHARLARAEAADLVDPRTAPERARAIMDERALALARVPPRPPTAAEVMEVAVFDLGDERYAIETRYVRRVIQLDEFTPIPGTPNFVVGIMNLRGEVLAVFALRPLLGLPRLELEGRTRVVVLGTDRDEFGVLSDTTVEVQNLRIDDVLEPPGSLEGAGRQLIRGVTEDALIVLDGVMLLGDPRLIINQGDELGA
jgi:purine-binding chemotaxis protein CheW